MNDIVISVKGLGKRYQVGNKPHWAIRDICFDVRRGDVLGIVGRNGAGKTTMLRVLSRITEPTEGEARIRGRIGTLLETGTGFHPELTGRENIFLNGAILGMRPKEIQAKFREIADFSGVGKFIDARVKTYSSGMRSRLTFAVAAHLDTEILMVDEVLAVGDIAFQEKCLKKMDQLTQSADRTILFVSHSMGAIQSLCNRALLIENSHLHTEGNTETVIKAYTKLLLGPGGEADLSKAEGRRGSGLVRFTSMHLEDLDGKVLNAVPAGTGARVVFQYESKLETPSDDIVLSLVVVGSKGTRLFGMRSDIIRSELRLDKPRGRFICTIPKLPLLPGNYDIVASCLVNRDLADKIVNVCHIVVSDNDYYGTGRMQNGNFGDLLVDFAWECEGENASTLMKLERK
jgi:lipopolysaccharide transport system ATP-binding protein